VLNAVKIALNADCRIISLVNVLTSSLAHESDVVVGVGCVPGMGVAATKSFTSQLVVLYRIMAELAGGVAADALLPDMDDGVKVVAGAVSQVLENPAEIQRIAREIRDVSDIYVLGRGVHYPIAVEAALKIKELTYIHAEGIAGGELKHGPLALMDSSAYVIIINPFDSTYEETLTSAREIGARGAKIIGVSDRASDVYDYWIEVPSMSASAGADFAALYPVLEIVPIQILAYYAALERDKDPDYPRNLAKSVTVR